MLFSDENFYTCYAWFKILQKITKILKESIFVSFLRHIHIYKEYRLEPDQTHSYKHIHTDVQVKSSFKIFSFSLRLLFNFYWVLTGIQDIALLLKKKNNTA